MNILAKRKMAIVMRMRIAKVILSVETTTAHGEIQMIAVRKVQVWYPRMPVYVTKDFKILERSVIFQTPHT